MRTMSRKLSQIEIQVAGFRRIMQDIMALFEDQVAKGNEEFAERFIASNKLNYTLLEEVKQHRNALIG